ncbi:MAG: ABC transporter ATP-binding protein [Candidatus Kariarchaeaceae archaeon]
MSELLTLLRPHINRHKKYFILLNTSTVVAAASQVLIPLNVSHIVDSIIVEDPSKSVLITGFFIILGFAILDLFANMSQRFASVRFAQYIIYDIRQELYQTLQFQELEYYSKETVGQIMARSIEEVFSLRDILTWGYRIAMLLALLFVGSIIAMVNVSVQLSLVFFIIPIVMVYIVRKSSEKNLQYFYDARFSYGEMSQALAENLSGIHTVKSFGREQEQVAYFNTKNQDFYDKAMDTERIRATLAPGMIFVVSTALIFLVFTGGYFVSSGQITPGNFVAFMMLVLQIAIPGRFIGWLGISLQDANSAAIRLNEIFNAPELLEEKVDARDAREIGGAIRFESVTFDYPETSHTLHNIDLVIPAGQKVALLGPTGAGKSTLINLIPRFFDVTKGRILIDGTDVKNFTKRSLRSQIGIVHQEAFLFTLSLKDNIALGNPEASFDEVVEAATSAQIHDFIVTLEDGYDTIVGERGVTLSGGQRQRVTIARTLLQNPKILIFDDSVSAVDPETEAKIQNSLESASVERTTIVISQRPSSLKYVDRIIVLDKGHIVQDGTHEELKDQPGIYNLFLEAVESQIRFLDWDVDEEATIQIQKEGNLE